MDIEKYRTAAIIAQSALLYAAKLVHTDFGNQDISRICALVDQYILSAVKIQYKTVKEKGISAPTEICKNEFITGIAPETSDEFKGGLLSEGDLVKISLGVHIDGYSVFGAHTVVLRESIPSEPAQGPDADAAVATYLANEAVVSMLCTTLSEDHPLAKLGPVTGERIKAVVEDIAYAYNCVVCPTSQVRRVSRFVVGQGAVQERSAKAVVWHSEGCDVSEFVAEPDQVWLVNIALAPINDQQEQAAKVRLTEFHGYSGRTENPTLYSRDYSITYTLKTGNARSLIAKADELSVFPFRLGHFAGSESELNSLRLGITECVQRRLLVPHQRFQARLATSSNKTGNLVHTAREGTTIALISAAKSATAYPEAVRLAGGKQMPPSWAHSQYELPSGEAADLLNARLVKVPGFKYIEVKGKLPEEKMDIE